MKLTDEMLTRAGCPQELRRFIEDGTISHYFTEEDGTLCFQVPKKDETKKSVSFHWHPEDPSTWRYEGSRFYAEVNHFHDREHHSTAGSELVPDINNDNDPNDISLLIDWLETDDD